MGTLLAVLLGVAAAGYYIWRGLPWKSPETLTAVLQRTGMLLLAGLALFSLARGGYAFALLCGAGAFFLGRAAQLAKPKGSEPGENDAAAAGASRVTTKWLDLTLNRSSGEISGRVLRGIFSGKAIADLSFDDLLSLREEVKASDQQSAAIISAYLDRVHGQAHGADAPGGQTQRPTVNMSLDEALDVLGLEAGASQSDVSEAHRRLMMLVHPDRGGSDYLAAKINAAKSVLLKK